jgi:uncharacterized membrane protein
VTIVDHSHGISAASATTGPSAPWSSVHRISTRALGTVSISRNAGGVTFPRLPDRRSRVTLQLDVEPTGPVETVGDAVGAVERRVEGDLKRFKEFIEARGDSTGAWRGEVDQDRVTS